MIKAYSLCRISVCHLSKQFCFAMITVAILLTPTQSACTTNLSEISMIRAQALEAEGDGQFEKADALYQKALSIAQRSGSQIKVLEMLSRIVQERIENHQLLQSDALVNQAIQVAQSLKNSPASDSTLPVWLNDMSTAFYSAAEHTPQENVKEYCLKRYIDIKFATDDSFDVQLLGRANLLIVQLQHHGRYADALPYAEKSLSYELRTKPSDINLLAGAYFSLGTAYLLANHPAKAEPVFREGFRLRESLSKTIEHEAQINGTLGNVKLEEGNLQEAIALHKKSLDLQKQHLGKAAVGIGYEETVLGMLEQRARNLTHAAQYFQAALDCFAQCPPWAGPIYENMRFEGLLASGQVIASEHLAQIMSQQGNSSLAQSLKDQAKRIRAKNPYWSTCTNPDPDYFYIIGGHLPFFVEIVATRSDLRLNQ